MEHQKSVKCPTCGGDITGDSDEALIMNLKAHAKKAHDKDLNDKEAKEIIARGHE